MDTYQLLKIEEEKLKCMADDRFQKGLPLTDPELITQKQIVSEILSEIMKDSQFFPK